MFAKIMNIKLIDSNKYSLEELLVSSFLSSEDKEYLSTFKVEQTKKEKAVSLIIKRKLIGEYQINEFGKPISNTKHFNISHSNGVVVYVEGNANIGIDIEHLKHPNKNMIEYISSGDELKYIKDEKTFFEIWTSKESLVKSLGTGINEQIKTIPGLPLSGVVKYKNKSLYRENITINDYVISVTQEGEKPFRLKIERIDIL